MERFNLEHQGDVERESLKARPGCVLVAVRDVSRLWHLQKVLEKTNMKRHDIVVMTVRPLTPGDEYDLRDDQIFADKEQHLFSKVVALAEKEGKTVELLVIPALDPFEAMVRTAVQLEASRLVVGVSARMASEELARRVGLAWEGLPERRPFSLEITNPDRPSIYVNLGPHPPRLWPEDVERVHSLWLKLSEQPDVGSKLHHRDIVGVALQRLERDVEAGLSGDVMRDLDAEMHRPH